MREESRLDFHVVRKRNLFKSLSPLFRRLPITRHISFAKSSLTRDRDVCNRHNSVTYKAFGTST